MKFVILTRFAVRFEEGNPRRRYEEQQSWIEYRLRLLRKYTVPSVRVQDVDLEWWFLISKDFPGITKAHQEELEQYGRILWMEEPWSDEMPEVGEKLVGTYAHVPTISMRLDSDDMIRDDYLKRARAVAGKGEHWISFDHGYIGDGFRAFKRVYLGNPFTLLVEPAGQFKSAFMYGHTSVAKKSYRAEVSIRVVSDVYGWLQFDHGGNIKNNMNNFKKFRPKDMEIVPFDSIEGFYVI